MSTADLDVLARMMCTTAMLSSHRRTTCPRRASAFMRMPLMTARSSLCVMCSSSRSVFDQ